MNPITMQIVADKYIRMALEEDINSEDVSTNAVMPRYQLGTVDLICKQDGIIAGLDVFARAFQLLDEKIEIAFHAADGDAVKKGQLLATVTGDIRVLLSAERTALNYLQRMSGIATYTHQVVSLLEGTGMTLVDTRKTTPNMRVFEKYAVTVGGGKNHRYNLSDGVLLKDNHISAAGGVAKAVADKIKEWRPDMEVKIASAQGLAECKKLLMLAKAGKYNGYLLEGMGCPGGCIGGAGTIADPVRTAAVLNKYVKDAEFTDPEQSAFMSNIHMLKDDPNFEL